MYEKAHTVWLQAGVSFFYLWPSAVAPNTGQALKDKGGRSRAAQGGQQGKALWGANVTAGERSFAKGGLPSESTRSEKSNVSQLGGRFAAPRSMIP